ARTVLLRISLVRDPLSATLFPYTTIFRSHRIVLSVDCRRRTAPGQEPAWEVVIKGGTEPTGMDVLAWVRRGAELGAGELVLNSRSEEHTSELQSRENLVCRLLLEKKKIND